MGRCLVAVALLTLVPSRAWGQAVTFDEAIGVAAVAPDVRAPTRTLTVRRARDGAISDVTGWTQIWIQPGWRALDAADQGYTAQYYVTQTWSLSALADLQRSSARGEREELDAEARRAALARRLGAARAWIDLHTAEETRTLASDLETQAAAELTAIERALEAGVRTRADVGEVRVWLADLALLSLAIEGRVSAARIALATEMALESATSVHTSGAVPTPDLPSVTELRAQLADLERLPEIELRRLAASTARSRAEETHAAFAPQLQLGVQLQNEAGPAGFSVFGIAGLSFGAADLGARSYAQLLGEAEMADAQVDVVLVQTRAEIERVLEAVEHERARADVLSSRLIPALEDLVTARETALRAREGTVFELMLARRRLGEARIEEIEVRGARVAAEVHAWLLVTELERLRTGDR